MVKEVKSTGIIVFMRATSHLFGTILALSLVIFLRRGESDVYTSGARCIRRAARSESFALPPLAASDSRLWAAQVESGGCRPCSI